MYSMSQSKPNRRLLHRVMEAALGREEQGYPPMAAHAAASTQRTSHGYAHEQDMRPGLKRVATTQMESLIPVNDKLLVFRALTGIDSVPALTQAGHLARSAPNVGIYTRVIDKEAKAQRAYKIFKFLINTCLGFQVVFSAAVTAVGAASGPYSAITAFGAMNTIMAGTLTYLRGSGLPDRLKNCQNQWKNIREYIEQREREFCLVACELDVQEEVFIVESMYQRVKSEMETKQSSDKSQQLDDSRIRRSVLRASHNSTYKGHAASARADMHPDAVTPTRASEPVSPITIPEAAWNKEKQ